LIFLSQLAIFEKTVFCYLIRDFRPFSEISIEISEKVFKKVFLDWGGGVKKSSSGCLQ